MPNWGGSTRKSRLPSNWETIRRAVLTRDGYRCRWIREDTGQRCNEHANQVDHIVQGADDDHPDALQSLCGWHHQRKSSSEGGHAAAARRKAAKKRRHPGLLP